MGRFTVSLAVAGLALVLAAPPASADQCMWVTPSQASSATEWLARSTSWVSFCEPCGDTTPALTSTAPSPSMSETTDPDFVQVKIDGRDVDLAYTFVPVGGGTYTNLAALAGCEAQGVSRTLALPSVTAAPGPTAQPAPAERRAGGGGEALLATALVWAPSLLWLLSLVGGAGFVLGVAFASRRQRRMTARALGLSDRTPPASPRP